MRLPPRLRMARQRLPPISNRTISTTLSIPVSFQPPDNSQTTSKLADAFPKLFLQRANQANTAYGRLSTLIKTPNVEPDIIWAAYEDFHRLLPSAPRELEQVYTLRHALRRSVPDWRSVRRRTDGRLPATKRWARLRSPHPFEYRMRTILQDIRELGHTPHLSDYHWVLSQLAAAGHATAAEAVLREMIALARLPTADTYALVLRACIRRLETRVPYSVVEEETAAVSKIARDVVEAMGEQGIEINSKHVSLLLRVFKAGLHIDGFELLLRTIFAFDIKRPDRMAKEFEDRLKAADQSGQSLPVPLEINRDVLTTMIYIWGEAGEISKMISAFEVLTNPYPMPSDLPPPSSSWWDDVFGSDVPMPVVTTPLSHRPEYKWYPQTTSAAQAAVNKLIQFLAWNGKRTLCQHYVKLAIELDKAEAEQLRKTLERALAVAKLQSQTLQDTDWTPSNAPSNHSQESPLPSSSDSPFLPWHNEPPSSRFMVTMETLLPAWGMANHKKALEMFRWMRYQATCLIQRKRKQLQWFMERQGELLRLEESVSSVDDNVEAGTLFRQLAHPRLIPEVPSTDTSGTPHPQAHRQFHVMTHTTLLQEAVEKLTRMMERIDEGVARLSQRTKERLTRRVLGTKDIYLRDLDDRVFIAPEEWASIVNYGPWSRSVTGPQKTKSVIRREEKYGDRSTWAQKKGGTVESTPQWLHEKLAMRNPKVRFTPSEEAESFARIQSEIGRGEEDGVDDRINRSRGR